MFNAPGRWSVYLSYAQPEVQHEAAALATALGQSRVWLDVFLEDISLPATEEGMRCSDAFVALLSPSYFSTEAGHTGSAASPPSALLPSSLHARSSVRMPAASRSASPKSSANTRGGADAADRQTCTLSGAEARMASAECGRTHASRMGLLICSARSKSRTHASVEK